MKYIVIKGFMDIDGFKKEGSVVELDDMRAAKLRRYGLIAGRVLESASIRVQETAVMPKAEAKETLKDPVPDVADGKTDMDQGLEHLGGGFYLLPNGEKVKGKKRAVEALKEGGWFD